MKNNIWLLCFGLLLHIVHAKQQEFFGATKLDDIAFKKLTVNGSCKGKKVVVTDTFKMRGSISLKDSKIKNILVHGACKIKKSEIETIQVHGASVLKEINIAQTCMVHGACTAEKVIIDGLTTIHGGCTIKNAILADVVFMGSKIELDDVTVKNILIKSCNSDAKQKLILQGKSVVMGNITCEDPKIVIEQGEDVEIKGKIIKLAVTLKDGNSNAFEGIFVWIKKKFSQLW